MLEKRTRGRFLREIVARPFAKAVASVMALLGAIATIREIVLPEAAQAKLNFYRLWSLDWPWWLWVILVLFALLVIVFESAYRAIAVTGTAPGLAISQAALARVTERIVDGHRQAAAQRPKVSLEWVKSTARPTDPFMGITSAPSGVRITNHGPSTAFSVEAVIDVGDLCKFRIGPVSQVGSEPVEAVVRLVEIRKGALSGQVTVEDALYTLSRKTIQDRMEQEFTNAREGKPSDDEVIREGVRVAVQLPARVSATSLKFDVTYMDFDGRRHKTPHVLTYTPTERVIKIMIAAGSG
jgi:hypothetical protein